MVLYSAEVSWSVLLSSVASVEVLYSAEVSGSVLLNLIMFSCR